MLRSLARLAPAFLIAASCRNGSSEGRSPVVDLSFPPPLAWTEAGSILVSGTAEHPAGIDEVRVDGVLATSTDGFATWQLSVPLAAGWNALTVTATSHDGSTVSRVASRIDSEPAIWNVSGIAATGGDEALLLDGSRVLGMDLATGIRRLVSDGAHGAGPELPQHGRFATAGDHALVLGSDGNSATVWSVDLASGDRAILSDDTHGVGPAFDPGAITFDGARALVAAVAGDGLVAIDLASGDRTALPVGGGPTFLHPTSIAVDGERAFVLCDRSVIDVDLVTGDRSIVSDDLRGTGPAFERPTSIVVDGGGLLVTDDSLEALLRVDASSGDRTIVSDASTGTGPVPSDPESVAVLGGRALVAGYASVLSVDLADGDRTELTHDVSVGSGPWLPFVNRIAVSDDRLVVVGANTSTDPFHPVCEVELAHGNRRVVTSRTRGSGPAIVGAGGIAVEGERVLVAGLDDQGQPSVFSVDRRNGYRVILSGASRGSGPPLRAESPIVVDGHRALVDSDGLGGEDALLAVDLASGDRTVVSDLATGSGPGFHLCRGMAVDGGDVFLAALGAADERMVYRVDLATGDRTIVSSSAVGVGPTLTETTGIAVEGGHAYVVGWGLPEGYSVVVVDFATGDRTILTESAGPAPLLGDGSDIVLYRGHALVSYRDRQAILAVDLQSGQRVIASR